MFKDYIVLDFESYYSSKLKYSLRNVTPVEYLLDPRFELIGCAVIECVGGVSGVPYWVDGPDFLAFVRRLYAQQQQAGKKIVLLSHNALFDMCLLVWRYGLKPDLMVDTMGMSQALLAPKVGYVSLKKISDYLGIGTKGDTVMKVDGMRREDIIRAGLYSQYVDYSMQDAILCERIFHRLWPQFPPNEFVVKDTVLRCAVLPKFKYNIDALYEHLAMVKAAKAQLLASAGIEVDEWGKAPSLMSNEKFAKLLEDHGVEPPKKISPTTGKETYAFSKADQGMADLAEHDDPDIQALVAARLGVKSTLEETRTQRFIDVALQQWPGQPQDQRWAPMPLKYSGAHTHRLSGDWKLNKQNMPRGGKLRDALIAPPGCVVITCDASQIEARLAAWLAALVMNERSELVELFAQGADVYSEFSTKHIYKRLITKADTKERFVGKQAILGLGFGMGWFKYMINVRKDSRLQLKIEIVLTEVEAKQIVNGYRFGMAPQVPKAWKRLEQMLPDLQRHDSGLEFGPMTFRHQEVIGPTGLPLFYPNLRQEMGDKGLQWTFKGGRFDKTLFGGKFYENIIQHLARCANMETALKVRKHFGIDLALQAHDELIYVVPGGIEYEELPNGKRKAHPTGFAAEFMPGLLGFMRERPAWGRDIPLDAEAGIGFTYGEAK